MKPWSSSTPPLSSLATSSALASIPATRCADMRLEKLLVLAAPGVIFGGIHATLYPQEAIELGGAHSVVKGDGDVVWGQAVTNCVNNHPRPLYEGGRIDAGQFCPRVGT